MFNQKEIVRSVFFFGLIFLCIRCHDECILEDQCNLIPNPGPCLAAIEKYYYDTAEKKCKEFIWGGCSGIVPFETLADCEQRCHCK